ncbi:MAG: type II toxin-antitoxin system VapC family toxin [Syntrophobacteria bacterium]
MKNKTILDSFALLAWIQDEQGAQLVEDLLLSAQEGREHLILNIINLGEIYYRLIRLENLTFAQDMLEKLKLLPLKVYPCDNDLVLEASEIKAEFPIAYADAFIVATAQREKARIVTGDPDFCKVEHFVTIEWLA